MIPSGDVAAIVPPPPTATVTKTPFPNVTEDQVVLVGSVLCVQVIPSGDVAAVLDRSANATKTPFPNATACQSELLGNVREVQEDPSEATVMRMLAVVLPAELVAVIV